MKLGIFVSDYALSDDLLSRLNTDNLGIVFVANGIYHATIKEGGKPSELLGMGKNFYALSEDIETRGVDPGTVDPRVKVVTYSGLVDVIFNEFEKIAWL